MHHQCKWHIALLETVIEEQPHILALPITQGLHAQRSYADMSAMGSPTTAGTTASSSPSTNNETLAPDASLEELVEMKQAEMDLEELVLLLRSPAPSTHTTDDGRENGSLS